MYIWNVFKHFFFLSFRMRCLTDGSSYLVAHNCTTFLTVSVFVPMLPFKVVLDVTFFFCIFFFFICMAYFCACVKCCWCFFFSLLLSLLFILCINVGIFQFYASFCVICVREIYSYRSTYEAPYNVHTRTYTYARVYFFKHRCLVLLVARTQDNTYSHQFR